MMLTYGYLDKNFLTQFNLHSYITIFQIYFNIIIFNRIMNHMIMRYYPLFKGRLDAIIYPYDIVQMTKNKNLVELSVPAILFQHHKFSGKKHEMTTIMLWQNPSLYLMMYRIPPPPTPMLWSVVMAGIVSENETRSASW